MRIQHVGKFLLGALSLCPIFAETAPTTMPESGPIQAELLARLNVRHLTNGSTIFARVTADWHGNGCNLRQGAILEARVESAVPQARGTHGSSLDLSFNKAQCNGAETTDYGMVLAAVAAAPSEWTNITNSAHFPTSFSNPNGNGTPGFGAAGVGDMSTTHLEFTGLRHNFPMRPNLEPGDVIDIRGLKLAVGKGVNRSSVLSAPNRDIALDAYTQFLLVPASVAFQPAAASLSASGESKTIIPRPPTVPVTDNFETCAPPGCAIDLPVSANELAGDAASSIAIGSLGYAPRPHKVIQNFDDEEALAWLGSKELLVTFNPHSLIKRAGPSTHAGPVRLIRAVLFDAVTHNIVRAVDWEVADWRRYLWPLEGNRILVHVGNELRIYAEGLNLESSLPLRGPLAFIRIAPNGILMAVATLNERHSAELHSKLHASSGEEPEEDVDIQILDKNFKPIAQAATTSNLMPPTLLNEGQVKLLAQPKMHYRLAMSTWDNKTVTLGRFESMCKPELSSFAPDLLFLVSCSVPGNDTEYRVLRADGKLVLRGKTGPQDVGQEAVGNTQNQTFALKVVHAGRALTSGQDFSGFDLESERVRIYRVSDGKPLFAVRVDQPTPSHSSYALSPEGSQLAVLSGSQVRFFPVTPQP